MKIITKNINLNVRQPNNFQLITAMQNDNETVEITATLYDGNKLYTIDNTVDTIRLSGRCANGAIVDHVIKTHTDHTVTFTLDSNMLASDGDMKLCIILESSTLVLSTYEFCIKVCNSPVGTCSQTEITTFTDYILEAKKSSESAEMDAKLSQSYAIGGSGIRDGEDADNSLYYKNLTKSYKEDTQALTQAFCENQEDVLAEINQKLSLAEFGLDDDGNLIYTDDTAFDFTVSDSGNLEWEVINC